MFSIDKRILGLLAVIAITASCGKTSDPSNTKLKDSNLNSEQVVLGATHVTQLSDLMKSMLSQSGSGFVTITEGFDSKQSQEINDTKKVCLIPCRCKRITYKRYFFAS